MKIAVLIPARNEEKYLGKTLQYLSEQTLKPDPIVVIDDGSTDKTAEIAKRHGAFLIQLENRGYNVVGMPELAEVLNKGFRAIAKVGEFDYVMVLGADHLLPRTYIEDIILRMEKDKALVMASGRLSGTPSYSDMPVGSGRIYRLKFMRQIGFFPLNYGWEDYPLFKALMLGHKIQCFRDIVTWEQRPIKLSAKKLYSLGKGMKALGYDPVYFLGKCARMLLKAPLGTLNMLRGYLSSVKKYPDVKDFTKKWQRKTVWKRIREQRDF